MTPQSDFMVTAPVAAGRVDALRALLATMNSRPGQADPANPLLPFGDFDRLHFARIVLLDDATLGDLAAHGARPPRVPRHYLALMGNCDGPAREVLADMAARAGEGLGRVFSHCEGYDAGADLLAWMTARDVPAAAAYVNWRGRTVRQVREEAALQRALAARVPRDAAPRGDVQALRAELVAFAREELRAGRLVLTPPAPTPPGWRIANLGHAAGGVLVALAAAPFALVALPFLLARLRALERSDPELAIRPTPERLWELQQLEDHDVVNQYSAIGEVKPGRFRHATVIVVLAAIDWFCRHVYTRGHLARIRTIHFARWALVDGGARVVFASSYDGSHEGYMDDFIGKAAWGLNLAFSNGVGYPRTDWLLKRGARREHRFKPFQRRHQLPTEVWYHAFPGLTAFDMARNHRIREGFERDRMSDDEALAWLRLL